MGVLMITGGSRGIGAAVARLGAGMGYTVAVNYRADGDAAAAVVASIRQAGGQAAAFQADVAVETEVEQMFEAVDRQLGSPTALVNSAGINGRKVATADFGGEELSRLMAVNVVGTMLCCREAVRRMSTRSGGGGGAIVNVSSMAATIGGRPGSSHYAASKAAVDAFTVGLAREVGGQGIRVNAIRPGMTDTDMTDDLRHDPTLHQAIAGTIAMNRIADVDEVTHPILWLLSAEASFVSGACLDASGGGFMIGRP